jgi:hypothetical protein
MSVQSIDDVVSALDAIIQRAYDSRSRVGYFAALYRRVTCAVRDDILAGKFQNNALMERLDVVFASRYLDALDSFQKHGTSTKSWVVAFKGCDNADLLILQQLMCGMNAHINLDLGIAAAQVAPGDQLPQLKPDFDAINGVLASLVGVVAAEIAAISPLLGDLEKIGLRSETSLVNFDVEAARGAAWLTAVRLAYEPSLLRTATIAELDLTVSLAGHAILYPVIGNDCLKLIQQAESKDAHRIIDVLSEGYTSASTKAVGAE